MSEREVGECSVSVSECMCIQGVSKCDLVVAQETCFDCPSRITRQYYRTG